MSTYQTPTTSQETIDEIRETCKRQIEDKQRDLNKANREIGKLLQQLECKSEELEERDQDLRRAREDLTKANGKASNDLANGLQQEKRGKEHAIADKERAIADRDHAMGKIARLEMKNSELQRYRRSDWQVVDQFSKAIEDGISGPIRGLRRYHNSLQESGYSEEGPGAAQLPGNINSSKYLPNRLNAIEQDALLPTRQHSTHYGSDRESEFGASGNGAGSEEGEQSPQELVLSPSFKKGTAELFSPAATKPARTDAEKPAVIDLPVLPALSSNGLATSLRDSRGGSALELPDTLGFDNLAVSKKRSRQGPGGEPDLWKKPKRSTFEEAARPSQEILDRHMEALKPTPSKDDPFFNDCSGEQFRRVFKPNKRTPEEFAEIRRRQWAEFEAERAEAQKLSYP